MRAYADRSIGRGGGGGSLYWIGGRGGGVTVDNSSLISSAVVRSCRHMGIDGVLVQDTEGASQTKVGQRQTRDTGNSVPREAGFCRNILPCGLRYLALVLHASWLLLLQNSSLEITRTDLELDGKTVAVPPRHEAHFPPLEHLVSVDEVLQDLSGVAR